MLALTPEAVRAVVGFVVAQDAGPTAGLRISSGPHSAVDQTWDYSVEHEPSEGDLVIGPSGNVRVLVATKPVDFRKGADGLAALVREAIRTDPFSGVVYVFRAKRADRVKLIFWDGTGVVLVAKRLENGKFSWPAIDHGVMRLSAAQLQALLEGLDWRRVHEARRTTVPTAAS